MYKSVPIALLLFHPRPYKSKAAPTRSHDRGAAPKTIPSTAAGQYHRELRPTFGARRINAPTPISRIPAVISDQGIMAIRLESLRYYTHRGYCQLESRPTVASVTRAPSGVATHRTTVQRRDPSVQPRSQSDIQYG